VTLCLLLVAACGGKSGNDRAATDTGAVSSAAPASPSSTAIDDPDLGAPLYPGATRASDKYLRAKIGAVTHVVGHFSSHDDIGAIVAFYLKQCGPNSQKTSDVAAERGMVVCVSGQQGKAFSILAVKWPSETRLDVITRHADAGAALPSG